MKLFERFKRKKCGGVIKAVGLVDYWESLTEEQRNLFREWYSDPYRLGDNDPAKLDSPEVIISATTQTASNFLRGFAPYADAAFAEKLLLEALSRSASVVDTYFVCMDLAELYYKQRESRIDALKLCERYCRRTIPIAEEVLSKFNFGPKPTLGTFHRLVVLLEKQGRIGEAVEICATATRIGIYDSTKGGYTGRIERLQKKLT